MRRPPSAYAKALVAGMSALATALLAAFGPDSTAGKWCTVVLALFAALGLTAATKNTATVQTGDVAGPVTVGEVVSSTGSRIGEVVVDTGVATGGIVAGTTGLLGSVLDATVGRLLPSGQRRQ
jgi:hypothetical protein